MKLMTKELEAHFKKVGSQEAVDDPIVLVKFFDPSGSATRGRRARAPPDLPAKG